MPLTDERGSRINDFFGRTIASRVGWKYDEWMSCVKGLLRGARRSCDREPFVRAIVGLLVGRLVR